MRIVVVWLGLALGVAGSVGLVPATAAERLPGTEPLVLPDNLVADHLKQVQGYFLRRIEAARTMRDRAWNPDFSSVAAYHKSMEAHRENCRAMLGLTTAGLGVGPVQADVLAESKGCRIERIAIPSKLGLSARGILFLPSGASRRPLVLVCSDADAWPERVAGLADGRPPAWLADLAGRKAAVFVVQSVERKNDHPYSRTTNGKDRRMVLYRLGYVVGRTMPGLDVQDVLIALDGLTGRSDVDPERVGVLGLGQGGMTALYAAAVDRRIRAAVVGDYFRARERCWEEPADRRLPGQLLEFGDAEAAALIAPRSVSLLESSPAAPGDAVEAEHRRALRFFAGLRTPDRLGLVRGVPKDEMAARGAAILAEALDLPRAKARAEWPQCRVAESAARALRDRHFEERLAHLRGLIAASEANREARWKLGACSPAGFAAAKAAMLDQYRRYVGDVPTAGAPMRPRSELALATEKYRAYRVLLDVAEGLEVYGNLLVPTNITVRAPAVICQHGLSGAPEMITGLGQKDDTPYHEFGRRLAERGYVVFAPLLLHYHPVQWTNDQARQADAAGMMRVAVPVAQTRRAVDFLQGLPFVDPQRIGYYGLSYGGYSALWISPLEERLAAVVVSGHFNDWRSKITTDSTPTSYLLHPDEDFYNWDVLHQFTHVELVLMTAPRPVCIEYGRRDGITTPEWTAYAWKQLCALRDRLGLADRIVMAEFDGVHEVHGVESFEFLDRTLLPK